MADKNQITKISKLDLRLVVEKLFRMIDTNADRVLDKGEIK